MAIFNWFGESEHRVFNYKPRYYDPEKEALKKKFGDVDGSKEKEPYTPGIPESLNVLLHELRGLGLKVTLD